MKGKKSALLYCDIIHTVEKMDNESAGLLFKHYLRYINDQEPEPPNLLVEIAFEGIKQNLKRDLKTWEKKIEARSEAGKKSAEARKKLKDNLTKSTSVKFVEQTLTNPTVNVNDNVNVTVKDNVINNINIRETEFKNSLQPYLSKYGKDLLNKFFLYWTEKKPKGRKMRFEMEKVFDIERRLITWNDRNYNNKNSQNGKPNTKSRIDKFTGS